MDDPRPRRRVRWAGRDTDGSIDADYSRSDRKQLSSRRLQPARSQNDLGAWECGTPRGLKPAALPSENDLSLSYYRRVVPLISLVGLCIISATAGCSINDLNTPERMARGLVVILPGIEGRSSLNVNLARGLDEGGVKAGIEIYDWTVSIPGGALVSLTNYERNRRVAGQVKDRILRYRRRHPGRAVQLIGHSGGGGIAVMAAEALPSDAELASLILLAPAISPGYDLSKALRRTRYGVFNHHSSRDVGFLVLGTSLFGTVDRRHGPSAGAVGFERPVASDSEGASSYAKLHQVSWQPRMSRYGHHGGHIGWTDRRYVRHYLAPLVADLAAHRAPLRSDTIMAGGETP